jgi:hypothetical protein
MNIITRILEITRHAWSIDRAPETHANYRVFTAAQQRAYLQRLAAKVLATQILVCCRERAQNMPQLPCMP